MIYLFASRSEGRCKIGYSANVAARFATFRYGRPDLVIEATREGGRKLEYCVHRAASEHRIKGEWFTFNDDVVSAFHTAEMPDSPTSPPRRQPRHRNDGPHAQAIDKAGGPRELAGLLDLPLTTVRSWHERSSIPAPYWQWFAEREYIALDELAAAAAAKKGMAA